MTIRIAGELFVREQRPDETDFKIAYRMGPSASAGVAEIYGSNVGFGPTEARALAHLFAAAPKLLAALEGLDLEDWPPLDHDNDCWFCEGRFITGKERQHNEGCALVTALDALAKVQSEMTGKATG